MSRRLRDDHRDAILAFIDEFWAENGCGPMHKEICAGVGIASVTGVRYHLRILREAGCVSWDRWQRGTLRTEEP